MMLRKITFWVSFVLVFVLNMGFEAQEPLPTSTPLPIPTSTPVQVRIASVTPPSSGATATPTQSSQISAPTPQDLILLEPISDVNVRSSPEISEENRIGSIRAGERYVVLGRYFNWVQFQYDQVPSNRGWVYRDLIEIIQGDEASIPQIELGATPTTDPQIAAATQTREAILDAPGGALTVTAQSRIIELPDSSGDEDAVVVPGQTVMPTFTYPPGISLRPTDATAVPGNTGPVVETGGGAGTGTTTAADVPPVVPILILGMLGFVGLVLSIFRG